jgi:hypothetical protein
MAKQLSRKDVIDKINAFLNMTVERGASENEALMAASRAAALLAEYDLTFSDLTGNDGIVGRADVFSFPNELARHMHALAKSIGELCAVEVLVSGPGDGVMHLIGSPIDVDFGRYLCAICLRAIEDEAKNSERRYALMRSNVKHRKIESVLQGMAHRLRQRIRELAWARRAEMANAIAISKQDVIKETKERLGIKPQAVVLRQRSVDPKSYQAGIARADQVPLNNAVRARKNDKPELFESDEDDKSDSGDVLLIGQG